MAVSVKGGVLTVPGSTGNQAVTGIGFQPKAVIFYGTLANDGVYAVQFGVATSSSARWASSSAAYNETSAFHGSRYFTSSKCWVSANAASGAIAVGTAADFVSMDADGFTINWSLLAGGGYPVNYLCIGGTDVSAKAGTTDTGTTTGNKVVTGVGFQPKALLVDVCDLAVSDAVGTVGAVTDGIGVGLSSSNRFVVANMHLDATPTDVYGVLTLAKLFTNLTTAGAVYAEADLVTLDSDGFTYDMTTASASGALRVGYLALGGAAQYAAGTFSSPGSTGNQATNGVGFTPSAEVFVSAGRVSNNSVTAHIRMALGAAVSSADRGSLFAAIKDNVAYGTDPDPSQRYTDRTHALTFTADDGGTVQAQADFVSQDSDGFTLNWGTADATARVIGYLAIGAAAGGGGGTAVPVFLNQYRQRRA